MRDAGEYVRVFKAAALANREDDFRQGNLVMLPTKGRVLATGDLHGHRRNFERIVKFADLTGSPDHHLILHEMIHGGPTDSAGGDLSWEMIFEAAKLKIERPDQVHILMGNHDIAQLMNMEVMRAGLPRCVDAFNKGLAGAFGPRTKEVETAFFAFLRSQPVAARAGNIFFSHSTPPRRSIADFDYTVFDRALLLADVEKTGPAYHLTWGRHYDQATADMFARKLGVDVFIIGHESQPDGFGTPTTRHVILASDHGHGVCLPITLGRNYTQAELVKQIKPLASLT